MGGNAPDWSDMTESRLGRIERLLERTSRDSAERDRQLSEKLDQVAKQQAQFQDDLNETKALQLQNAQAISQLTQELKLLR